MFVSCDTHPARAGAHPISYTIRAVSILHYMYLAEVMPACNSDVWTVGPRLILIIHCREVYLTNNLLQPQSPIYLDNTNLNTKTS